MLECFKLFSYLLQILKCVFCNKFSSAVGLTLGKKSKPVAEAIESDPYKLKHGGFVDMKKIKDRNRDR